MAVPPEIPAEVWEKASQKRMRYLKRLSNETGVKAGDVVVSQTEVMDMAQERLEEEILRRGKEVLSKQISPGDGKHGCID